MLSNSFSLAYLRISFYYNLKDMVQSEQFSILYVHLCTQDAMKRQCETNLLFQNDIHKTNMGPGT